MPNRIDELFAEIATSRQFVTREEIERARGIQSGEHETRRIGTILLAHRYITKDQADAVLAEIRDRLGKTARRDRPETRGDDGARFSATARTRRSEAGAAARPSRNGDGGRTNATRRVAPPGSPAPRKSPSTPTAPSIHGKTAAASRISAPDPGEDARVARAAIERGYLTNDEVAACQTEQARLAAEGVELRLGQLFLKKGKISADQFMVLIRESRRASESASRQAAGSLDETRLDSKNRFGPFTDLVEIARGGMGIVFKARDPELGRVVALKVLRDGKRASAIQIQRFENEIESAADLLHPNIVRIHGTGEVDGDRYFTMEYVEGSSLEEKIQSGETTSDIEASTTLMAKVARAVDYAHEKGVIHRDLKPANILIGPDGEPKVTDFGLAKVADTALDLTRSEQAIGTPAYMSPEQARGDSKYLDRTSDVFSLGIILYQLIAGRLPFEGATTIQLFHRIVSADPTPPRSHNRKISRDLDTICLKALEKETTKRYPTAGAFATDLERSLAGLAISARAPSFLDREIRRLRRHALKFLAPAVALAVVALAWGAIESYRAGAREADQRIESFRRIEKAAMEERIAAAGRQLSAGNYRQAIEEYGAILAADPVVTGPRKTRDAQGNTVELEDGDEARIVEAPERAKALLGRGRAYLAFESLDEAERDFAAARELAPAASEPLLELAQIEILRNRLESALELASVATRLAPDAPDAWILVARILVGLSRHDESRIAASRALEIAEAGQSDSRRGEIRGLRALAGLQGLRSRLVGPDGVPLPLYPTPPFHPEDLSQADRADLLTIREDLLAATRESPSSEALTALAETHLFLGEWDLAWDRHDQAVSQARSDWRPRAARGLFHLLSSDYASAAEDLDEAARAIPASDVSIEGARAHLLSAAAALSIGDVERAAWALERARARWTTTPLVEFHQGLLEETLGQHQRAIESYGRALDIRPDHVPSALRLAAAALRDGSPGAVERGERALAPLLERAADPISRTARQARAELVLASGDPVGAHELLLEDDSRRPGLLALRGAIYRATGSPADIPKARDMLGAASLGFESEEWIRALMGQAASLAKAGASERESHVLELVSALEPRFALAHDRRARLSIDAGDIAGFRASAAATIESDPFDADRILSLAEIFLDRTIEDSRVQEAVEDLLAASGDDPRLLLARAALWPHPDGADQLETLERSMARLAERPLRGEKKLGFYRRAQELALALERRLAAAGLEDLSRRSTALAASCREVLDSSKTLEELMAEADQRLDERDRPGAIAAYTVAIEEFADSELVWRLYYKRGRAGIEIGLERFAAGDHTFLENAFMDYARAVERNYAMSARFFKKVDQVQSLQRVGSPALFQAFVDELVDKHPDEAASHFLRGVFSLTHLQILLAPDSANPVEAQSQIEICRENARASLERTLDLEPSHAISHVLLGYLHQSLQAPEKALAHYHAAYRLGTANSFASFYLASYYAARGDVERTTQYLGRVFKFAEIEDEEDREEAVSGLLQRIDQMPDFAKVRTLDSFRKYMEQNAPRRE